MTLQEILKAKGIADADIESILGEMKQNKIYTTSHENMDVRYPKLKGEFDTLTTQHGEATQLIEQFKAGAKDNEALQSKITSYESTIQNLTEQVRQVQLDAAMDRTLTSAGAKPEDLDYLKFQWKKKGDVTMSDNGEIKGADDVIAGLKTQHPAQFATANAQREVQPQRLPDRNNGGGAAVTQEQFQKMGYESRVKLRQEDPQLYDQLMKG